ncbi:MAG: zf-HC2 domain-containing protein [Phycisphaerales bacterium]|nr:zf-HC2 domain-containing protein [Phycisphaerales bacterium]
MNCERFESLLADALGDELSSANRQTFEEHLRTCERCRHEYESSSAALSALRSLPAPSVVPASVAEAHSIRHSDTAPTIKRVAPRWLSLLRYAAAIVIAFAAGYFYRAERASLAVKPGVGPATVAYVSDEPGVLGDRERFAQASPHNFEAALAGAHLQDPSRSDLAKCMIAMFATRR